MADCFLSFAAFVQAIPQVRVAMLELMLLLPDLTSPTPYAKSCHGKECRVQGSMRRRTRRRRVGGWSCLASSQALDSLGRQRSWSRELPRGCHVSGGLGESGEQTRRSQGEAWRVRAGQGRAVQDGTHEYWVLQAVLLGGGEEGEESG
jgi:hypothetical protein